MSLDCEQARVDRVDSPGFFQSRECGEAGERRQPTPADPAPGSAVAPMTPRIAVAVNLEPDDTGLWHTWTEFRLQGGGTEGGLTTATIALVRKMAEQCAHGWEKRREWGLPEKELFELHYQFACLARQNPQ